MKASELIKAIQQQIDKHGDLEVLRLGSTRYEPVTSILYNADEETDEKYKFLHKKPNTFII